MTEHVGETWSYTAGDWFGMVGPAVTLLLPPSERDRVAGLWPLVDDGADFDAVLDALLGGGLSALPGFVLVGAGAGAHDGTTRVLVRGAGVTASVRAGGQDVDLDGGAGGTWTEQTLTDVERLTVSTEASLPAGRPLPIIQGLVRVSRIDRPEQVEPVEPSAPPAPSIVPGFPSAEPTVPPPPVQAPSVEPAAESQAVEPPPVEPSSVGMPTVPPPPMPPPSAPPGSSILDEPAPIDEPAPVDEPSPLDEAAPLDEPPADLGEPAQLEEPALLEEPAPVDEPASVDEAEAVEEPAPLEPPAGMAAPERQEPVALEEWTAFEEEPRPPAGSEPTDDDAPTILQPALDDVPPEPDAPDAEPEADLSTQLLGQPETAPVATLTISDGQTVPVEGPTLIGRAPQASRATGTEEPLLVTVPSPLQEISSTHVEVRPDAGGVVVTDMDSTNGTVVVQPGTGPEELQPGAPVPLPPGSVINLGDGVTIEVS